MTAEQRQAQLKALRDRLDLVDADLVALAAERQRIVSEIGRVKQGDGRQVRDFRREREVLDHVRRRAAQVELDPDLAEDLLKRLITASLTRQEQERGRLSARGTGRRALVIGGGGRLGRWMAEFLDNQGFDLLLADPIFSTGQDNQFRDWRQAPIDVDLVVLATPIGVTVALINELIARGQRGLIVDLASVKGPLITPLRKAARAGLRICSIHPMFGPDTRLLSGRHVLLMDVGCPAALTQIEELFADTMAELRPIDIEQHDRLIAWVLGLSHALNIAFFTALAESGLPAESLAELSSTTFDRQLAIARNVASESPELYYEIQKLNEHGHQARLALATAINRLADRLSADDPAGFKQIMEQGREYLARL